NIVPKLGIVGWIFGVPRQVFARELALDQFRVFGEEKNPAPQADPIRPFFNLSIQQRRSHNFIPAGAVSAARPYLDAGSNTHILRPSKKASAQAPWSRFAGVCCPLCAFSLTSSRSRPNISASGYPLTAPRPDGFPLPH